MSMHSITSQLAARLLDEHYQGNGSTNAVFGYGLPDIVAVVYREHVDAWFKTARGVMTMTPDERLQHETVALWLRRLETGHSARLFCPSPQLSQVWWDAHVTQVVSKNPGNRRVVLPLDAEIHLCIQSLQPHYVAWVAECVDERHLRLDMFPTPLLYRVHQSIAEASPAHYYAVVEVSRRRYRVPDTVLERFSKPHFASRGFPRRRTAGWPGLRLCPPFFPDMNRLLPAPSTKASSCQSYIIVHACLEEAFAITVETDASECRVQEIQTRLQAHQDIIGVRLTRAHAARVLATLQLLDGVHPRSFAPGKGSPYARAARALAPVHMVGPAAATDRPGKDFVKLPESACMDYEVGFSFSILPPRLVGGAADGRDDYANANATNGMELEPTPFYEVRAGDMVYRISSYTGFGLRLRHKLLHLIRGGELHNKSAAIILPDGLTPRVTEDILRTCVDWLHDLGLNNVKLLSEGECNAMCLGALSAVSQKQSGGLWVSVHDGLVQCRVLGVRAAGSGNPTAAVADEWPDAAFACGPLAPRMLERLRDFVLRNDGIAKRLRASEAERHLVLDSVRAQSMAILAKLDRDLCDREQETATFAVVVKDANADNGDGHQGHQEELNMELSREEFRQWISYALGELWRSPWWDGVAGRLEEAKGVVIGGGLFEMCGRVALQVLQESLGPGGRLVTRKNRLSTIHGAALAIYGEKGYRSVQVSDGSGGGNVLLPIRLVKKCIAR